MGILVLDFLLLAAGADAVEKGLVPRDYVARLPLDHAIERVVMLYHGVADGAAAAADYVRVRIAATVKAIAARHFDADDIARLFQQVEVAIYGAAAHLGILLVNVAVDILGGGVVAVGANDVQDQRALFGVSALHAVPPPYPCMVTYRNYIK